MGHGMIQLASMVVSVSRVGLMDAGVAVSYRRVPGKDNREVRVLVR